MSLGEQRGHAQTFSQAPESNYWIRFLRYREYRFAIKACLNLLPVASHKWKYSADAAATRCKGCTGNIETQKHCLSVCPKNITAIRARHNKMMERVVRAITDSLGKKFLDQAVPVFWSDEPDVVILNEEQKKAYLVDVTCPYESAENLRPEQGSWISTQTSRESSRRRVLKPHWMLLLLGHWGHGIKKTISYFPP